MRLDRPVRRPPASAAAEPSALAQARARVERLREELGNRATRPVRLIETHVSWVLLADELAYKLKKPVRLPFLDFTTLAARLRSARRELHVNRRLAPQIYRDVVEVVETARGPRLGGAGTVVDAALRMNRFADGALWSERVARGQVRADDVDALAATLAEFHAHAAAAPSSRPYGRAERHAGVVAGLLVGLPDDDADVAALRRWLPREAARLVAHFEARRRAGKVRECHGDLHLANIAQIDGRPVPFDAIEFDESLRWIDPVEDVAFVVMDLLAHGAAPLAWRFFNEWLSRRGDYEGLPALRFHLVCRALVRANVLALRAAAGGRTRTSSPRGADYVALGAGIAASRLQCLAITHGLPGTGKTVAARALSEAIGAVVVRSDVERKRLFGLSALERSGRAAGLYTEEGDERTYQRLRELARIALDAGWPVVVDAAFLRRDDRVAFRRLARDAHVPFSILACAVDPAVARLRVRARLAAGTDASEADESVLRRLAERVEPLDAGERACATTIDGGAPAGAGRAAQPSIGTPPAKRQAQWSQASCEVRASTRCHSRTAFSCESWNAACASTS